MRDFSNAARGTWLGPSKLQARASVDLRGCKPDERQILSSQTLEQRIEVPPPLPRLAMDVRTRFPLCSSHLLCFPRDAANVAPQSRPREAGNCRCRREFRAHPATARTSSTAPRPTVKRPLPLLPLRPSCSWDSR